MSLKIALITLVLASMLSSADFLKCYTCAGGQCTDNPMTCPSKNDSCVKWEVPLPPERDASVFVFLKSCGNQDTCNDATNQQNIRKSEHPNINCCKEDLCNGAGTIGKNLLLLLVPVASIFVLS